MFRYFGQPKFHLQGHTPVLTGYELFLREKTPDGWRLPEDFTRLTPADIAEPLKSTLSALPDNLTMISLNLEQCHFIEDAFLDVVAAACRLTTAPVTIELVERHDTNVSPAALLAAAQRAHAAGILVCLDDVGTAFNNHEFAHYMNNVTDEYKFALQNLRPFPGMTSVDPELHQWAICATNHNKLFTIEGIETDEELDFVADHYPEHFLQGYRLGKPALLPVAL